MAREELEQTQLMLQQSSMDSVLGKQVQNMRRVAWNLSKAERKFFFQKAKCRYIISTYWSIKLFHAIVRRNANRNLIPAVVRVHYTVIIGPDEVVAEFLAFYQSLLSTHIPS